MRARAVMLASLAVVMLAAPVRADHLEDEWIVGLDQDAIEAGVGSGSGGGSGGSGGGGSSDLIYVYTLDPCTPDGDPYSGPSVWVLVMTPDGQVVDEFCLNPDAGQSPPPPPTAEEVLNQAPLPRCEIRVNPRERGLTGVETWLWCERVQEVSVSAAIRGYRVEATATPQEFHWFLGDGAGYVSSHPGTEEDPSARHTYETKGDYVVEVAVAWSGSFTYRGHGVEETGSLDGVTVDSDRGYHVIEARGVLEK